MKKFGEKMQEQIKKNFNNLLIIFILLQPILDLITGLCIHLWNLDVTLGIIIRVLFLAFIMYTTIFIYKKKKSFICYCLIGIYSIFYLLGILLFKDPTYLFQEVQGLVRTFYFPILLISLYDLREQIKISKMTLVVTLFLYLILIFIPIILGVGYKSYEITKAGTLGFFNSANEISGMISLLTPIMIVIFTKIKKGLPILLLSIIYFVVILTVGTKTPLLSLGITLIAAWIYLMIHCLKEKKYQPVLISTGIIILGSISFVLIIPKTNFYKNIKTHMDYLKVDSIGEVLEKPKLIDHFIFSQRLTFLEKKDKLYDKSNIYQKIFGIGYLKKNKTTKMIEMDYFDIYYSHGVAGFIIFFVIYGYVLISTLKERQKLTFERYMLYISCLLILFLSLFTGHIITAPAVSLIVAILILMLGKKKKKDLLFTAYNMEIGGIETALINLLNNIDYKKYNVDVILEEKKGILLSKVNKNVKVLELKVSNHKNPIIRKGINLYRKMKFSLLKFHTYDFSCCYATYSLSANVLARTASSNNTIYIHSNYKDVYHDEKEERKFFDRRKIEEFRLIIFVSNESKKDFIKLYPHLLWKTQVLNNFIDTKQIIEKSKEKIEVTKDSSKKLFVFVGRLDDSSKKLGRAINLVQQIKEINLWIVGDGPDKEMYQKLTKEKQVEDRVSFLGRKENPYPYMKQADYIILTSDYEGFPVTYLEAITLNIPIITTIPVSDDQINIKEYAHIISKDEKKMVKEVKEILKRKTKIEKIDVSKNQEERKKHLERIFNGGI